LANLRVSTNRLAHQVEHRVAGVSAVLLVIQILTLDDGKIAVAVCIDPIVVGKLRKHLAKLAYCDGLPQEIGSNEHERVYLTSLAQC
jgi:hypothetical protein